MVMIIWGHKGRDLIQQDSVQFSHSVVSDSLQPHESQHQIPPYPSPTPGVYSNSCPSSWWCHPTISSCHPLLLPPSIFPSIRVFSNDYSLIKRDTRELPLLSFHAQKTDQVRTKQPSMSQEESSHQEWKPTRALIVNFPASGIVKKKQFVV